MLNKEFFVGMDGGDFRYYPNTPNPLSDVGVIASKVQHCKDRRVYVFTSKYFLSVNASRSGTLIIKAGFTKTVLSLFPVYFTCFTCIFNKCGSFSGPQSEFGYSRFVWLLMHEV